MILPLGTLSRSVCSGDGGYSGPVEYSPLGRPTFHAGRSLRGAISATSASLRGGPPRPGPFLVAGASAFAPGAASPAFASPFPAAGVSWAKTAEALKSRLRTKQRRNFAIIDWAPIVIAGGVWQSSQSI